MASTVEIHWADVRDAAMDFVLGRAFADAAYPAYLLVRAFSPLDKHAVDTRTLRSLADDLWLTLVAFRTPEALPRSTSRRSRRDPRLFVPTGAVSVSAPTRR